MPNVRFTTKDGIKNKVILSAKDKSLPSIYSALKETYVTIERNNALYILVNLDKTSDLSAYKLAKIIIDLKLESISLDLDLPDEELAKAILIILERTWKLTKFKSEPQHALKEIEVVTDNPEKLQGIYKRYEALILGSNLCKELAESPSNVIYPKSFAAKCHELTAYGVSVEVLGLDELTKLKMNAILAVSQGSSKEPRVVVMKYLGDSKNPNTLSLVGKGVCFDSGGLFIKDQATMPKMKYDKSGAAVVVGGILSIAAQKLKVNVIGIIGLVENMPDGNSIKPSDIITSMSGKTIEIADPDAEGRLVLADCLYYTQSILKPSAIITFATLTADTIACLAHEYAGLFTYDEALATQMLTAAAQSKDYMWRLPLGEAFKELTKSDVADIKNVGINNCADNASAAEFLCEFVGNTRFAHLDIAGVVWSNDDTLKKAKGSTGYGVKFIEEFARNFI
jgi:leucyl aminopeptidase